MRSVKSVVSAADLSCYKGITVSIIHTTPPGMGLIIIGTEILNGRRTDRHFDYCRARLAQHRLPLIYSLILTDEPELIESHLRACMARPEPFFCCGGIGGTPDDSSRYRPSSLRKRRAPMRDTSETPSR